MLCRLSATARWEVKRVVECIPQGGLTAVAFRPEQLGPEDLIAAVSSAGHDGKHYYSAELLDMRPARTT